MIPTLCCSSSHSRSYLDFGRTVANPNDGISFVVSFAFTGNEPGNWERVFDFGSGPDSGNFILARMGVSNDLAMLGNWGGATSTKVVAQNVIRPGRLFVAVGTHLHGTTKFYLDGNLVGQNSAQPRPGLQSYSQSYLGRSNWGHDAFFNGQIFYFQSLNMVVSEAHQRLIFRSLSRAANSVIGYIPASAPPPAPAAPVDLRDAALPCGDNLLASEGLTNVEGTARLIMQSDGNLVLYNKNGKALWASGTAGQAGDRLEVQTDGNLVVYALAHGFPLSGACDVSHVVQVPRQQREVGVEHQRAAEGLRAGCAGRLQLGSLQVQRARRVRSRERPRQLRPKRRDLELSDTWPLQRAGFHLMIYRAACRGMRNIKLSSPNKPTRIPCAAAAAAADLTRRSNATEQMLT